MKIKRKPYVTSYTAQERLTPHCHLVPYSGGAVPEDRPLVIGKTMARTWPWMKSMPMSAFRPPPYPLWE